MRDVAGLNFHCQGGVATVTLNRPERLNAITWKMVEGLVDFTEECSRDDAIRVIVVTGNGRAFSSGDDIVEGMGEIPARHGAPGGLGTDLGLHHAMVQKLLTIPKPVVAAINGRCHGAGLVIALACDFRVARADALVGDIRTSKAIFAGQSVPLILSRLIGQSRTMDQRAHSNRNLRFRPPENSLLAHEPDLDFCMSFLVDFRPERASERAIRLTSVILTPEFATI